MRIEQIFQVCILDISNLTLEILFLEGKSVNTVGA